jgi:hypothetical protein
MEVTVEHIVRALRRARAEAEFMAERFPDYRAPLLRFARETSRVQQELLENMHIGGNAES